MNDSALFRLGLVAALYAAYLVAFWVLGEQAFGAARFYWFEGLVTLAAAVALFSSARRAAPRPRVFFGLLALALALLFVTNVTYEQDILLGATVISSIANVLFLFVWILAWGYLALELARRDRPTRRTVALFVILMTGLVLLFVAFYYPVYEGQIETVGDRLDVAIAALQLGAVVASLAGILLGVPSALVLLVFGLTVLAGSDMLYTGFEVSGDGTDRLDPLWMLGLFLLLAGALVLPGASRESPERADFLADTKTGRRSGLSGFLLTISLGAVLVTAAVDLALDAGSAAEPVFFVFFVVLLVVVMVWVTDRFDRAVAYVRGFTKDLLDDGRVDGDWHQQQRELRAILSTTGLGHYMDRLEEDVRRNALILGPEPLYEPVEPPRKGHLRAFIVMPFGAETSDEIHEILRRACKAQGVVPVRADDLFRPTDILDDIWREINAAHFTIADITGRNPNVLYELGIAHTLAKPVLILSHDAADIPSDLSTRRVLIYGSEAGDWAARLEEMATAAIGQLIRDHGFERGAGTSAPEGRIEPGDSGTPHDPGASNDPGPPHD